jgi:hypothetical protein
VTVIAHHDRFRPEAPDEEWLGVAGVEGWVVLTKDKHIRHRDSERAALMAAGAAAFILRHGYTGERNAAILVAALPRMTRFLMGNRRPFIAAVTPSSKVVLLESGRRRRDRRKSRPPRAHP